MIPTQIPSNIYVQGYKIANNISLFDENYIKSQKSMLLKIANSYCPKTSIFDCPYEKSRILVYTASASMIEHSNNQVPHDLEARMLATAAIIMATGELIEDLKDLNESC